MTRHVLVAAARALALVAAAPGQSADLPTDANIVTGIDISDSVQPAEVRAQLGALGDALRAPDFLAAVRRGPNGRIAVAVFLWHHDRFEVLPWTVIGSPAEAEVAARLIETRVPLNVDREAPRPRVRLIGRLTDLSGALDHAGSLLAEAEALGGSGIVNILGNGRDNMGEAAAPARARLLGSAAAVNGVVFGGDPEVIDYYRREAVGGAGAFVIAASGEESLSEVMHRKLLHDLVAVIAVPDMGRALLRPSLDIHRR